MCVCCINNIILIVKILCVINFCKDVWSLVGGMNVLLKFKFGDIFVLGKLKIIIRCGLVINFVFKGNNLFESKYFFFWIENMWVVFIKFVLC